MAVCMYACTAVYFSALLINWLNGHVAVAEEIHRIDLVPLVSSNEIM